MRHDDFYNIELANKCLEAIRNELHIGAKIDRSYYGGYNIVPLSRGDERVVRVSVDVFKAGVRLGKQLA